MRSLPVRISCSAVALLAGLGDDLAVAQLAHDGHVRPALQRPVVDPVEEVDRPQVLERRGRVRGHLYALRQVLVRERDRHRAFADGARDALDRARADVAGDEHAGDARLQQVGIARERPAVAPHVGPGEDEASRVARDGPVEPVGPRRGADEDEAGVDLLGRLAAVRPAHRQAREVVVLALGSDRLRAGPHLDVGEGGQLLDQVVRHRGRQRGAAHEHRHLRA